MASLQELRSEHEEVLKRLEELEKEAGTFLVGQVIEGTTTLSSMVAFIEKAILPHFGIEERIIFPLLAKGTQEQRELADELVAEHLYLKECFFHYLKRVTEGKITEELLSLAHDMALRLAAHAKKEDIILIPFLRKWLQVGNGDSLPEHAPPIVFSKEDPQG